MVYINNQYDVTLAPTNGIIPTLLSATRAAPGKTFEQARQINRIYQNNGRICQQAMCNSMMGCDSPNGCPTHPDWNKVVEFCGPSGTPGMYMQGAWYQRIAADSQEQAMLRTEREIGMKQLPTPYNMPGMY